jgi:hypothetical protein
MDQQYETISKFDRAVGGLLAGNNLHTKAATVEEINKITGEAETYIIQTIRDEAGEHIVVKFVDKDGNKRLILPPKAASTIVRQREALSRRARSNHSKAAMKERMAAGYVPVPPKRKRVLRGGPQGRS